MAEGDTIHRTAQTLRAMVGDTVTVARSQPGPGMRRVSDLSVLVGAVVTSVDARGKHLLIGFDNGLTLRSHLRMTGSWRLYPASAAVAGAHRASAVLQTNLHTAVARATPTIELLSAGELRRSRPLATLGPDLLGASFDADEALGRLRQRDAVELGVALLDQRAMAGVGNVYKSEAAFLTGLDPWAPVGAFSDDELRHVLSMARRLLQANVRAGPRSTTGRRGPGETLWVYGRAARPCRRCGTTIRSRRQGEHARLTYWCPNCQPTRRHAPQPPLSDDAVSRHD